MDGCVLCMHDGCLQHAINTLSQAQQCHIFFRCPYLRPAQDPSLRPHTPPPPHRGPQWCTGSPSSSTRGRSPPPTGPAGRTPAPGRRRCSPGWSSPLSLLADSLQDGERRGGGEIITMDLSFQRPRWQPDIHSEAEGAFRGRAAEGI